MLILKKQPSRDPDRQVNRSSLKTGASWLALMLAAGSLAACAKKVEKTEDIRPVRVIQASQAKAETVFEIPGEVRPRIESRLGFRVPGKITARKVELGTRVKKGQLLMQLDPQDLALAQAQAKAGLIAAQSNRDLAATEFKRYQDLRSKNYVSAAVLDAKEVAYKAAQASFDQAQAAYKNQSNQAGYASLLADADGVITGIDAEVGQVVAAGTPVVRIAQGKEMDVVIGVPEDKINLIKTIPDIKVKLWANPGQALPGKLRELSPLADPASRTYLAKISIQEEKPETAIQLGMTATVSFSSPSTNAAIRLPMTALFQEKNQSAVWLVQDGKVQLQAVTVASTEGEQVLIAKGVQAGQVIVTAGVNLLKNEQKVNILNKEALAKEATAKASASAAASAGSAK